MTDPGAGRLEFGSGRMALHLVSPDGKTEFVLFQYADGTEHYARRAGDALQIKTSPVPKGANTELAAASRLLGHLQDDDLAWTRAVHVDQPDCDCVLERADGNPPMRLQVVVADVDQERWRLLSSVPAGRFLVEDGISINTAAARVHQAIAKKEKRYDDATKAGLHLVLDAYAVPEVFLGPVRENLSSRLLGTGFAEIWIVGPDKTSVWKAAHRQPC